MRQNLDACLPIEDRHMLTASLSGSAGTESCELRKKLIEIGELLGQCFLHAEEVGVVEANLSGEGVASMGPGIGTIAGEIQPDVVRHDPERGSLGNRGRGHASREEREGERDEPLHKLL